jgi:hypothetical protein
VVIAMGWLQAFGCGLLLLCLMIADGRAQNEFHDRIVGVWGGDYLDPRKDEYRITIEKDSNGQFKLKARMKGIDQTWQQAEKPAQGQPLKFRYKPRTVEEIPDEAPDGVKLTAEIQNAILASEKFEWKLEFRDIEGWGTCNNTILNGSFYPGVIELEKTDKGDKFISAVGGGKPKEHHFHRLNPSVYFVNESRKEKGICEPFLQEVSDECTGTIYKFIFPGSEYDTVNGRKVADDEIERTKDFYAKNYCMYLRIEELPPPDAATTKKLKDRYARWYAKALRDVGDDKKKLGTTGIKIETGRDFLGLASEDIQRLVPGTDKERKLLIVFMDHYVAWIGRGQALVSGNQADIHQVGINWVDSQSPYILAHELIHAFGKARVDKSVAAKGIVTGKDTWLHNSGCPNALSSVSRDPKTSQLPINDLAKRFLDTKEYSEIGANRAAGALVCRSMVK